MVIGDMTTCTIVQVFLVCNTGVLVVLAVGGERAGSDV
jgi:hypothetical protein